MSIFKDTIKPEVRAQLRARQQVISTDQSTVRNNQLVGYLSKNSWVKMTSLVDYDSYNGISTGTNPFTNEIEDPSKVYIIPDNKYSGNQLSKKYQLFGGTLYETNNSGSLRYGVDKVGASYGSDLDQEAYRSGRLYRGLGIRPMPGINNIQIVNKSAYGSLREATVKFYCWDKHQLEDLEILFMRPGYSVILEWGWSKYVNYNNTDENTLSNLNSKQSTVNLNNLGIKPFPTSGVINAFDPNLTQQKILDLIEEYTKKHRANYDGMLGYVKNFNWTLLENGGYECTTTLISIGEVISSLKASSNETIGEDAFLDPNTPKQYQYTDYEKVLLALKGQTQQTGQGDFDFTSSGSYSEVDLDQLQVLNIANNIKDKFEKRDQQRPPTTNSNNTLTYLYSLIDPTKNNQPVIKRVDDTGQEYQNNYNEYISFRVWLAIMDAYFTLKTNKNDAYCYFDLEPSYCLASRDSISIDPFVCYVRNDQAFPEVGYIYSDYRNLSNDEGVNPRLLNKRNGNYTPSNFYETSKKAGNIAGIYISLDYLLSTFKSMNSSTSNDGVDILSYVQNVLNGISTSLGGLNNFKVFVNNNKVQIGDTYYVEDPNNARINKKFQFDLMGLNSICRDVKITSRIFQEQSTMIAIGAQDRGNIGDIYSSTQTLFNAGLTDRIAKNKLLSGEIENPPHNPTSISNGTDKLYNKLLLLATYIKDYVIGKQTIPGASNTVFKIPYPKNPAAASSTLRSILLQFNPEINYKALIPFELEITLDGISGFVIGQIFTINKNILPKDYSSKNLGFIITGISHSLNKNDWTTTLKTQICLLDDETGTIDKNLTVINKALIQARKTRTVELLQTYAVQSLNYAILRDFILYQANRSLTSYMFADMTNSIAQSFYNKDIIVQNDFAASDNLTDISPASEWSRGIYTYESTRYQSFKKFIEAANNNSALPYFNNPASSNAGDFITKIGDTSLTQWYPAKTAQLIAGPNAGIYADGYGYSQFATVWLESLKNNSRDLDSRLSSDSSETLRQVIDNYLIEIGYYVASNYTSTIYNSPSGPVEFQYFRPDFYLPIIKDQLAPSLTNVNNSIITPNGAVWKNTFRRYNREIGNNIGFVSANNFINLEYDKVYNNIDDYLANQTVSGSNVPLRVVANTFQNLPISISTRQYTNSPVYKNYDIIFNEIVKDESDEAAIVLRSAITLNQDAIKYYQLSNDAGSTGALKRSPYSFYREN